MTSYKLYKIKDSETQSDILIEADIKPDKMRELLDKYNNEDYLNKSLNGFYDYIDLNYDYDINLIEADHFLLFNVKK